MEHEILSWLDATRETRQETGFVQKRLYGMNLSKLVELIDRAGKFSLLVLGDALVKVH